MLPEEERNRLIDDKITAIKEQENTRKEQERREQAERNFYRRNDMLSRGDAFSQGNRGGDWYFYNPVTIALGKNDFKRKTIGADETKQVSVWQTKPAKN